MSVQLGLCDSCLLPVRDTDDPYEDEDVLMHGACYKERNRT